MLAASLGLAAKAKFSAGAYFDSWNRVLLDGILGGLMVSFRLLQILFFFCKLEYLCSTSKDCTIVLCFDMGPNCAYIGLVLFYNSSVEKRYSYPAMTRELCNSLQSIGTL